MSANEKLQQSDCSDAAIERVREEVGRIPDPEIPVVTLAELGILRDVAVRDGVLTVTLTPTYSGCPATEAIASDVHATLRRLGYQRAKVVTTLTPPWSTDWISTSARDKLRAYGIAPPCHDVAGTDSANVQPLHFVPACPQCGSLKTECLSEFGSTPCKAMYRCLSCREPFDYFKPF